MNLRIPANKFLHKLRRIQNSRIDGASKLRIWHPRTESQNVWLTSPPLRSKSQHMNQLPIQYKTPHSRSLLNKGKVKGYLPRCKVNMNNTWQQMTLVRRSIKVQDHWFRIQIMKDCLSLWLVQSKVWRQGHTKKMKSSLLVRIVHSRWDRKRTVSCLCLITMTPHKSMLVEERRGKGRWRGNARRS